MCLPPPGNPRHTPAVSGSRDLQQQRKGQPLWRWLTARDPHMEEARSGRQQQRRSPARSRDHRPGGCSTPGGRSTTIAPPARRGPRRVQPHPTTAFAASGQGPRGGGGAGGPERARTGDPESPFFPETFAVTKGCSSRSSRTPGRAAPHPPWAAVWSAYCRSGVSRYALGHGMPVVSMPRCSSRTRTSASMSTPAAAQKARWAS